MLRFGQQPLTPFFKMKDQGKAGTAGVLNGRQLAPQDRFWKPDGMLDVRQGRPKASTTTSQKVMVEAI